MGSDWVRGILDWVLDVLDWVRDVLDWIRIGFVLGSDWVRIGCGLGSDCVKIKFNSFSWICFAPVFFFCLPVFFSKKI